MFQVHASSLAAQLEHAERRRVVDVDGVFGHLAHGANDALKLVVVQIAVADAHRVHAGFGPNEALNDLLGRHLQGEEGHGDVVLLGGVEPDIEGEGCFSDAGPRRQDDEVRTLQAAGQGIEAAEAGGYAGGHATVFDPEHQLVADLVEDLADGEDVAGVDLVGDAEDQAFGLVQHLLRNSFRGVGGSHHAGGALDDLPQDGGPAHDGGVVLHVEGRGHGRCQFHDPILAAHVGQRAVARQLVAQRDVVRLFVASGEGGNRGEDGPVGFAVEVVRPDLPGDAGYGLGVDEQAAEQGAFGVNVLGRKTVGGRSHGGQGQIGPPDEYFRIATRERLAGGREWLRNRTVSDHGRLERLWAHSSDGRRGSNCPQNPQRPASTVAVLNPSISPERPVARVGEIAGTAGARARASSGCPQ